MRWLRCGRPDQPRSWLAAALRSCAASLRQAAGDALWAGGGCHRLLLAAGHSLDAAGLTGPAVAWWRELAADSDRLLGPGHPDTLVAGGLLADALLAAGQAAEAVTWSRWVLAGRASVLGPDHPGTIAAQVSLGRALVAAGKPGEALAVLEEAAAPQRAGPRTRRRRHPGRPGRIRRRVPGRGRGRRGDPLLQAVAGRPRAPARPGSSRRPWPPRCGWPAPAWPPARPRTPSPSTSASWPAASGPRPGSPGHAGGPRQPGRRLRRRRADGRRAAAAPGGLRGVRARLRRRSPGHPGPPRGPGPRLLRRRARLGDAVTLLRDTITRSEQALSPGDPLTRALRQALADITGGDDGRGERARPRERNAVTELRLHHRRRRHGRLRAGRPAQRGSRHPGAAAGSGQRRADPRHDRAGRVARTAGHRGGLGRCHHRAGRRRAAALPPGPGAGRVRRDQRHGPRTRPPGGLRRLGRRRGGRLGIRGPAAVLPAQRAHRRPRPGAARHRRPGPGRPGPGSQPASGRRSRSPRPCAQLGCPVTDDLSGARQEGVAWADLAIDGGQRVSPADAYLRPALHRPQPDRPGRLPGHRPAGAARPVHRRQLPPRRGTSRRRTPPGR